MSTLIRTNLGNLRVTVTRPHLTNNAVLWSVVQNPERCALGGLHIWGRTDDSRWTHCRRCDLVREIQRTDNLGHGHLYGSVTEGLEEGLRHAEEVRQAALNLSRAIAMPDGPDRRLAVPRALRIYTNITGEHA